MQQIKVWQRPATAAEDRNLVEAGDLREVGRWQRPATAAEDRSVEGVVSMR